MSKLKQAYTELLMNEDEQSWKALINDFIVETGRACYAEVVSEEYQPAEDDELGEDLQSEVSELSPEIEAAEQELSAEEVYGDLDAEAAATDVESTDPLSQLENEVDDVKDELAEFERELAELKAKFMQDDSEEAEADEVTSEEGFEEGSEESEEDEESEEAEEAEEAEEDK